MVNNNAAAVLLVLAALAEGRDVRCQRGESVEIGGAFRVPEVMEQSGARLVDVGTTNRTRLADYQRAIVRARHRRRAGAEGPPEQLPRRGLRRGHPDRASWRRSTCRSSPTSAAACSTPTCPWLHGPPPAWLAGEPAAVQTLADGADLVTFSGDKLLGGPQAGIIAGRADLVERCARHPLARALRRGGLVLAALQGVALVVPRPNGRRPTSRSGGWSTSRSTRCARRARQIVADAGRRRGRSTANRLAGRRFGAGRHDAVDRRSRSPGDRLAQLRGPRPTRDRPVAATAGRVLDLRSVDPADDRRDVARRAPRMRSAASSSA